MQAGGRLSARLARQEWPWRVNYAHSLLQDELQLLRSELANEALCLKRLY